MDGPNCPTHGSPMQYLSTSNEWVFYCEECDVRYSRQLERMPVVKQSTEEG